MQHNIEAIIKQMTLEEKAALCTGASSWTTTPIERLDVPELICSDGPHGVRRQADVREIGAKSLPATCFPTASCLASSWDVQLIQMMGQALAEESIALNVDVLLGPGINMKRSPLGGRNFEYFSEDPYLAGELATSLISGIQSKGVGTSLKHFAVNNQEYQRFSISAELDERTLREIYLAAFEKAVKKAKPWTVMASYNKVNGTFATENEQLLTEILKKEWGFEGVLVSDWGAVRDRVAALKAGIDWEMPGPQDRHVKAIVAAVKSGELDVVVLDESVRHILEIVFRSKQTPKTGQFDTSAHHELARKVASESMVLLKNNGILPLQLPHSIAVIGRSAKSAHFQGGGSSHINPTRVDVPLDELKSRSGNAILTYAEGYPADNSFQPQMIEQAAGIARVADVAVLYIALPTFKESEGYDRKDMDLTRQQVALIQAVSQVQPNTIVVLNNGAPVAMGDWIDGVEAVLEGYMMGQAGGAAIADILFGRVNPSGKLAETFPRKITETPAYLNWPGSAGKVRYGEGLYIGYRYYDALEIPVLFPFGYGLSYTTFAYSQPRVSSRVFDDVDGLTVSVDLTNTGQTAGKEVVQFYVHDHQSELERPVKELKGFVKVDLQPGETKTVSTTLDFRAFAYYHPQYKQWITEDGDFDILIGASAADIRHSVTVTMKSTLNLPCILDKESTLREWLADPCGKVVLGSLYPQIEAEARKVFGGQERYGDTKDQPNAVGMGDIMEMMNDMPLVSVLMFQQKSLPTHPEEMVANLLEQVHNP